MRKICVKCKRNKNINDYGITNKTLYNYCKGCRKKQMSKYNKRYYEKFKSKINFKREIKKIDIIKQDTISISNDIVGLREKIKTIVKVLSNINMQDYFNFEYYASNYENLNIIELNDFLIELKNTAQEILNETNSI